MKTGIFLLLLGFVMGTGFAGELPTSLTADEIVRKANHMTLYQGQDSKGQIDMEIVDKQGRIRKRNFNILRLDNGPQDEDQKYFVFFQSPADVRKMVFLVHKHSASEKDDDRWMYLPSLDLVKRIASGDKRTSFVGSDFLYEDISGRSPDEDEHELVETTDEYYVIKNMPKNPSKVEFEYYTAYIDRKTFLPIRIDYFKKEDRLYRVIETVKTEEIQAKENDSIVTYPTVTMSIAKDLETMSKTRMMFSDVRYNIGLSDKIFTERYLRRPPRDAMR
ncbi:MAG: outer membrane lipoprotein-sorting protein [Desulfotalea sp.]|nr:MAG: outer membrane lipoprotein-sorting protein [Desulfotalea sp.]